METHENAPNDLPDRERHGGPGILSLSSRDCDRFDAGVKCRAENEDRRNPTETIRKGTWISPVLATNGRCALHASSYVAVEKRSAASIPQLSVEMSA